jgi:hypothetical protein
VIGLHASSTGIDANTMKLNGPAQPFPVNAGTTNIYGQQFAAGWSSVDFDGDNNGGNCASQFNGVTQHYGNCWVYNLGSDGDTNNCLADGRVGPHLSSVLAGQLALSTDGTQYTRVQRITRYVKW